MRGGFGVWPELLNKITGCESRTVPPLYVLMVRSMAKASHWGIPREGRPERGSSPPQGMSQKTYAMDSPTPARLQVVSLSQKNGCGTVSGAAAILFF